MQPVWVTVKLLTIKKYDSYIKLKKAKVVSEYGVAFSILVSLT